MAKLEEVDAMLSRIDELGVAVEVVFNNAGLQIGYRRDYLNTPSRTTT